MTTSEKLVKIAENQIKVYNAGVQKGQSEGGYEEGKKDYGKSKTVTGNPVALKYIHPKAHNMEVKLLHSTITDFSNIVVKEYGKNILPYPYSYHSANPHIANGLTFLMNDDGSVTINGTATAETYYQFTNPNQFYLNPGKYCLWSCPAGGLKTGVAYTYIGSNTLNKLECNIFTATSYSSPGYFMYLVKAGAHFEDYVIRPMLCLADFGSQYVPYVEPIEHIATSDGIIQDIVSKTSDMTLIIENRDINIEATYSLAGNSDLEQFWDDYQENGRRADCQSLFRGPQWSGALFEPRHNIVPITLATQFFGATSYIGDLVERLNELGIILDLSRCPNIVELFTNSKITHLGIIDTSSASGLANIFAYAGALETIDLLVLKPDGSQQFGKNSFINCSKLTNITIQGKIGKFASGQTILDFSKSTLLTTQSMRNIINSLADFTDTTNANKYTISFAANCWTALEAENTPPSGYDSWQDYVVYGLKWNI